MTTTVVHRIPAKYLLAYYNTEMREIKKQTLTFYYGLE